MAWQGPAHQTEGKEGSGNKDTSPEKNAGTLSGYAEDGIRKAKAQMELNLARDVKSNKGFYSIIRKEKKKIKALISKLGLVKLKLKVMLI